MKWYICVFRPGLTSLYCIAFTNSLVGGQFQAKVLDQMFILVFEGLDHRHKSELIEVTIYSLVISIISSYIARSCSIPKFRFVFKQTWQASYLIHVLLNYH